MTLTERAGVDDAVLRASERRGRNEDVAPGRAFDAMRAIDVATSERFDRIASLAARTFGVQGAAINLLDRDRQWSWSSDDGMPEVIERQHAFCAYTIEQPDTLVVEDALTDPRFTSSPLVTEGGMRFYAGVPLLGAGGERVGAFCLVDPHPRTLDEAERARLAEFAEWAQDELELSTDRLRGFQVQQGLLPAPLVSLDGYEVAGLSQPMSAVGGDFYDWYPVGGGAAFTFGDVMGKGISAALIAATVRATMRAASRVDGPAAAVESAADTLDADLDGAGVFVTLFHAHLLEASGALTFIDAGHGLALVVHEDGRAERLGSTGLPLGAGWENTWDERTVRLLPGDVLVCVSDGVLDAFGGALDALERVERIARTSPDARTICDRIAATAVPEAPDDVTVVAVRRAPAHRITA